MTKLTKVVLSLAVTAAIGAGGIGLAYAVTADNDQKAPVITAESDKKPEAKMGSTAVVGGNDKQQAIIWNDSLSAEDQARLEKKLEEGRGTISKTPNSSFVEGTPSENDLTKEEAIDTAKSAIVKEFKLTDETLSKFSISAKFNVVNPKAPIWSISFYPTNQNDFSQIGTYNITIDSLSGKIIKILSAADAVG